MIRPLPLPRQGTPAAVAALALLAACGGGGGPSGPPPAAAITSPADLTIATLDVAMGFAATCTPDGGHDYTVSWTFAEGAPAESADFAPTVTFATGGAHQVTYQCTDSSTGVKSAVVTRTVIVEEGPAAARRQTGRAGAKVFDPPAVRLVDKNGIPVPNVTVTFTVTAGGGALSATSVQTGVDGSAKVDWTLDATAAQSVHAAVAGGGGYDFLAYPVDATGYTVDLRALTDISDGQWAAFQAAAARIGTIITGKQKDLPFSSPFDCGGLKFQGTVDDLMILVQTAYIDGTGGILGQSGPCAVRSSNGLPGLGLMSFDSADLSMEQTSGTLDEVILHEMLHVVGFGTIWTNHSLLSGAGTTNPLFTGATAIAQLRNHGGAQYPKVPVEGCSTVGTPPGCGPGTRDAHWTETIFQTELMTGWLDGTNELSAITIGSLQDLGYQVNLGAADAYTLPAPALAAKRAVTGAAPIFMGHDTLDVEPTPVPDE